MCSSVRLAALALMAALAGLAPVAWAEPTPGAAVPSEADGKIATEIEHRLSQDREVVATTVELDVRGGIVTLTGRVPSAEAKERAEKLAAGVGGVKSVRNLLEIGTAPEQKGPGGAGTIPERMPEHP